MKSEAEGSKEKEYRPGSGVQFTNMDPLMISLFIRWLKVFCAVEKDNLIFDIYVHKTHKHRLKEIIAFFKECYNKNFNDSLQDPSDPFDAWMAA